MDTKTDQIKREIEEARERISETTSEIGERIRSTFDWRQQVAEHPWAAVGIATAAGFLIGAATSRAFRGGRGFGRIAESYGEPYGGEETSGDAPSAAEATSAGHAAAFAGPSGTGEGRPFGGEWPSPGQERSWKERGRETMSRTGQRLGRAGAATGSLMATVGAALAPQLQEVGRTLADQLKDLSNQLIAQGKEYLQQRVADWKPGQGRTREAGRAAGDSGRPTGGGSTWPTGGGSSVSSESAPAWPTGSPVGGGQSGGAGGPSAG